MLNELINFVQEPSEDNASGPFFEKLAGPARGWSHNNRDFPLTLRLSRLLGAKQFPTLGHDSTFFGHKT